jgi:hypothetical protein
MENPDLRKALGMKPNQKGVRIRRVEPTAPAAKQLQSSDILLSFDNVDIANDGTGSVYFSDTPVCRVPALSLEGCIWSMGLVAWYRAASFEAADTFVLR